MQHHELTIDHPFPLQIPVATLCCGPHEITPAPVSMPIWSRDESTLGGAAAGRQPAASIRACNSLPCNLLKKIFLQRHNCRLARVCPERSTHGA